MTVARHSRMTLLVCVSASPARLMLIKAAGFWAPPLTLKLASVRGGPEIDIFDEQPRQL